MTRAGEGQTATTAEETRVGHVIEEWWITTDFFRNGGSAFLGPFKTYDLALTVREFVEQANRPTTYAIDSSRGRCNG